jgi:hypothetical protein
MTLKDKFAKATNKGSYYVIPIIEDAEIIEKIADEFAIVFAKWLRENDIPENAEKYFGYSDSDMLEEFKKEKGL